MRCTKLAAYSAQLATLGGRLNLANSSSAQRTGTSCTSTPKNPETKYLNGVTQYTKCQNLGMPAKGTTTPQYATTNRKNTGTSIDASSSFGENAAMAWPKET